MTPNEISRFAMTVAEYGETHRIPLEYYDHNQEYFLRAHVINKNPTILAFFVVVISAQYPNAVCVLDSSDWLVYRLGTVFDLIQPHNQPS